MLTIEMVTKSSRVVKGAYGDRTVEETVRETVPLAAPKRFGMYTRAGDKRLQDIAEKAMVAVEKAGSSRKEVRDALVNYVAAWDRLGDTKTYSEAGDTAVREAVGFFFDSLAVASRHWTRSACYSLWEEIRDEACRKVRKERERKLAAKK